MVSIARECGTSSVTVRAYFDILEDLLLSFWVPIFAKRAQMELVAKSKFYYFDAGVYRTLRPKGPIDKTSEIDGFCLEGLVAQHLKAWCDYYGSKHKLYFWQTKSKKEVDFIIYGEEVFVAFEVKNTDRVRTEDLKPLELFGKDYPEARLLLIFRGEHKLKKGNVLCVPCEEFLRNLTSGNCSFLFRFPKKASDRG
jgi:predicted AAA+ superfamily ATPase